MDVTFFADDPRKKARQAIEDIMSRGEDRLVDVLVIHAEGDTNSTVELPWRIHLCLNSDYFDQLLRPPANVRLFLYRSGTLRGGWQYQRPIAAYSGKLTGQNLTSRNPNAGRAGTTAEWSSADYNVIESNDVLHMAPSGPPDPAVATQSVLYIDATSDLDELLFSVKPKVDLERQPGERRLTPLDPDMRQFFRSDDVQGDCLRHVPYVGRKRVVRIADDEARPSDVERVRSMLGNESELLLRHEETLRPRLEKRHPFIVRARFRFSG